MSSNRRNVMQLDRDGVTAAQMLLEILKKDKEEIKVVEIEHVIQGIIHEVFFQIKNQPKE